MSKKTLLNETQVRRFMKLANVGALSDGFVNGLNEAGYFQEMAYNRDEEGEDAMGMEDELPGDEGPADELDAAADMGDEMGPEEPAGLDDEPAMDDAAGESLPPEVVAQVEDALAQALGAMEQELEDAIPGLELSVEQDGGEMDDLGAEEDAGLEDMDAMDDEGGLGMGDEAVPGEEEPAGAEDPMGDDEMALQESALVERIVKRVAERLRATTSNTDK